LALPTHWTRSVKTALIQVMSLAHYALVYTRGRPVQSSNGHVRHSAKTDQLAQEIVLLREEIRIKDARLARIPPAARPHYQPTERLAILELRALRGWSLAQTARVFLLTTGTIASWCRRLDEDGPAALLRTPAPVNKFPDFVCYLVQRLQTLCPRLGKVKIAQMLARAGLHLGTTTIHRMRRQRPAPAPTRAGEPAASVHRVTAKYPNHVWHVDLTTVPTSAGFWTSWLPFALPQCWPFCWWLAIVLDHYSRRALGFAVFVRPPTSNKVRAFLGQVVAKIGAPPRHLITDRGKQFSSKSFRSWCRHHAIRQRFGAVGKPGSIAVIERFIRTLKEWIRLLPIRSLVHRAVYREAGLFIAWYNADRPHTTLKGVTPDEVYFRRRPACRQPRFEPRPGWPRSSPCAKPQVLVKGQPGARLELAVEFVSHRRHLPRISLKRAA
jgi:putative transposase